MRGSGRDARRGPRRTVTTPHARASAPRRLRAPETGGDGAAPRGAARLAALPRALRRGLGRRAATLREARGGWVPALRAPRARVRAARVRGMRRGARGGVLVQSAGLLPLVCGAAHGGRGGAPGGRGPSGGAYPPVGVHAAVGGAEGCRLQACVLHGAHRGVHGGAERGAAAASEAGLRASERG